MPILSNEDSYFKLYILLYADDTVIFAESDTEMQAGLNAIYLYCKAWDLEVNPTKIKITIFSNKKPQQYPIFTYDGQKLEIDNLGTQFSYNSRFQKYNQHLIDRAHKAMFTVLRKSRKLHLPVDVQLQLLIA